MEEQIYGVKATRSQAKEFKIKEIRNPGQRMPVTHIKRGKRPFEVCQRETLPNIWVIKHITVVVKINKFKADNPAKQNQIEDDEP